MGIMPSAYLLDVLDAFDDVVPLDSFFNGVCVTEDGEMFLKSLLYQCSGKGGEMGQFPQYLQHLTHDAIAGTQSIEKSRFIL